ncbi:SWIM zinc finger [Mesobacillus persicus]|uniref:SWIM zinc finger n=1 Tax=Mesobacillus persicus TaxID=930146 RepID=A0A1H8H1F9_9BACI|nr:SWIM zinc finger [Mesobacillus persicus]
MAMVPELQVPKLKEAANDLKRLLRAESEEDSKVVQKGLMLYRQGLVHHLKFVGGSIWATIQDVTPVRVYVSLADPNDSTCTCPAFGFCRHRMAAFFHAYDQVASVADWVEDWRKPAKESEQAEKWGMNKAKDLIKGRQDDAFNYKRWISEFQHSFEEIVLGQGKPTPYVIASLFHGYMRQLRATAPIHQEWKALYELVGNLYAFKQLTVMSENLGHSSETVDRYYRYLFDTIEEDIEDLIASLSVHSLPFDFDPFMEELKNETAELIETEDQFNFERVNLYRMFWSNLLKKASWRDEERERLEKFGDGKRTQAEDIALAHQYFLARRDKDTLERLKQLGLHTLPFMFYWIEELTSQGDMPRAGDFIEFLTQHVRTALDRMDNRHEARDFTRYALRNAKPYFRSGGREDLYEKLLSQTLPYSFIEYEDFLFAKGHYDKWGELFTYANFESLSVPNDKLKIVQKDNPVVLLPILHQAVDGLIAQKNRSSYKQAVRLLKKLRTIYKKLKRVPEWETFFKKLLDRNKRLRAFHAECERAKLIEPKVVEE